MGKKRPTGKCSRLWHLEADGWFDGGAEVAARLRKKHPEICQAFHCCSSGMALTVTTSSHSDGKKELVSIPEGAVKGPTYTSGSPRRTLKCARVAWLSMAFV